MGTGDYQRPILHFLHVQDLGKKRQAVTEPLLRTINEQGPVSMILQTAFAQHTRQNVKGAIHYDHSPLKYRLCLLHSHHIILTLEPYSFRHLCMNLFSSPLSRRATAVAFVAGTFAGSLVTGAGAALLGSAVFSDVEYGSYYDSAVGDLYNEGIIKGLDATHFGPDQCVTRGQVAVLMKRLRDELKGTVEEEPTSRSSRSSASSSRSSSAVSSSSEAQNTSRNPRGSFRFTTSGYTVNENTATVTISVVRTGGTTGAVTVDYTLTGVSATAGTDFVATNGTLNFPAGDTSKTFTVQITDDASGEGNETLTVALTNATNDASIVTPSTATITIVDNELSASSASPSTVASASSSVNPAGTISFGATSYAIQENMTTLTVTVLRAGGTTGTVNVNYATSNGSATSGSEYSSTNGTLTFSSGETSKTFTVGIIDDTSIDGSKSFNMLLSGPTGGANLQTSSAAVSILDNEAGTTGSGSIKLSKSTYEATENDGVAIVTVLRTGGSQGTITVNYATTNGSANAGADYTAVSGMITFLPGEAGKTSRIPIIKDRSPDSDETFMLDLMSPSTGVNLISPYSATVTIY